MQFPVTSSPEPNSIRSQAHGGQAHSPMWVVREFMTPGTDGHVVYFSSDGVRGPGFGLNQPKILSALLPINETVRFQMGGAKYFISMIPEERLSTSSTEIPEFQPVPDFAKYFQPIESVLISANVQHDCEVDLIIWTGRGVGYAESTKPSIRLNVIERGPDMQGRTVDVPVHLSIDSEAVQDIFRWYFGAKHGLISWKWKRAQINPKVIPG